MTRRSLDHTLKLLRTLDRAGSVVEVVATVREHLAGFGVRTVIAGLLPPADALQGFSRSFLVLEDVPEPWRRRYLRRGYARHDPVVAATLERSTGFRWADPDVPRPSSRLATQVMGEAAEIGLRDGYTVPLTTIEGEPGGMSFVGDALEMAPEHHGMLTLIASYAFGHALLARALPEGVKVRLSPRERETLQWVAEGKTDWEIGEIMCISEHGVDAHLRCVRAKLGSRSRAQAVAEGLRRGFIV